MKIWFKLLLQIYAYSSHLNAFIIKMLQSSTPLYNKDTHKKNKENNVLHSHSRMMVVGDTIRALQDFIICRVDVTSVWETAILLQLKLDTFQTRAYIVWTQGQLEDCPPGWTHTMVDDHMPPIKMVLQSVIASLSIKILAWG